MVVNKLPDKFGGNRCFGEWANTPHPVYAKTYSCKMCKKKTKTANEEEIYIIILNTPYGAFC